MSFLQASKFYDEKDYPNALKEFLKEEHYFNSGTCLLKMKEYYNAIFLFKESIFRGKKVYDSIYNIIHCYCSMGERANAEKYIAFALSMDDSVKEELLAYQPYVDDIPSLPIKSLAKMARSEIRLAHKSKYYKEIIKEYIPLSFEPKENIQTNKHIEISQMDDKEFKIYLQKIQQENEIVNIIEFKKGEGFTVRKFVIGYNKHGYSLNFEAGELDDSVVIKKIACKKNTGKKFKELQNNLLIKYNIDKVVFVK